ncbi:sensor histidine kinase [Zavarzinella formosa]|uniref:sensor histidine kinase n=1 Tax=Zavarzinella formosa TaxID=360055 RepID=UPI0003713ABE|nr:PAS domain-containing sensor histidine kinase [Zavarzinella formosa]
MLTFRKRWRSPIVLIPPEILLATTEQLLPLALEQSKDHALILIDPDGIIVDWLAGAEHIFGYGAAEMIGKPLETIFTPEDRERGVHVHEMTVAAADGRSEDDRWQVRKDGFRFWAGGVLTPLRDPTGTIVGFSKVLRDRTDVKAQIDALANSAGRHKAFIGTIAHELRNPLAPIANAVQIMRLTPGASAFAAPVQIVERQVALMRHLVDDLMDFTRVGAGKVTLRLQKVCFEDVLNLAADACRPAAEQRRHSFKVLLLPTKTIILADPDRLQQTVVNLLNNSIKYTPVGGEVWLKATVEGNEAVFRVEDTGCGIAPDMLPRIFDLFTQETDSLDSSQGGLGLGLPLVKELVTLHGGSVQVRSEGRNKGSEFSVRLPLFREGSEETSST